MSVHRVHGNEWDDHRGVERHAVGIGAGRCGIDLLGDEAHRGTQAQEVPLVFAAARAAYHAHAPAYTHLGLIPRTSADA